MPKGKDDSNRDETETDGEKGLDTTRRRWLGITGGTIVGATLGLTQGAAASSHPHTILFDGTVTPGKSTYSFEVTDSVEAHGDIGGVETDDQIQGSIVEGVVHRDKDAYRFSGNLSFLDVTGQAAVRIEYGDDPDIEADRLAVVASDTESVDYSFTVTDHVEKVTERSEYAADSDDTVTENSDGSWTVEASTANGGGDTFDFWGEVSSFAPSDGEYTLFLNGEELSSSELTGRETTDREHSYSFVGSGDSWADYYLEVQNGGDMIASTIDGAVIEEDFHWISDDGTKAAGRVDPGESHAYEFDTLVADVTIEGEAEAYVNGRPSNLDRYPQPEATGNGWKGGFPWQDEESVDREHSYSFVGSGDSWADYYLEVYDGGDVIASTIDGAVIEEDFHWISDDGTKAAGRVDPGERHAYEFDTLVADVTIEGEAEAYVNGRPSNLSYYPQPGASGDDWKGGFPWQDEGDREVSGDGLIGGGDGYSNVVSESEATTVVSTRSELENALWSASNGDVVYVDGNAEIDLTGAQIEIEDGVTLASDRGIDGSSGALLYVDDDIEPTFWMRGESRFTGIEFRGAHPGEDFSGTWYGEGIKPSGPAEIDNCELRGFGVAAIEADGSNGGACHVHHNHIHHNCQDGRGYGVSVVGGAGQPVIEYNYFDWNRHSVATDGYAYGYIVRFNHFGPNSVQNTIDAHGQNGDYSPAGTSFEVHNNVIEQQTRVGPNESSTLAWDILIRGVPEGDYQIHDNWLWNPLEPDSDGPSNVGPDELAITQSAFDGEQPHPFENVSFWGNYYGENANVTYSDVIPGYDGWRS